MVLTPVPQVRFVHLKVETYGVPPRTGSAKMDSTGLRNEHASPTLLLHPPAVVNVLAIEKESLVQKPYLIECLSIHEPKETAKHIDLSWL